MFRALFHALFFSICLFLPLKTTAEDAPPDKKPLDYPAEMNKKFANPNLDIQKFVERFENENRDIYVKRREIAQAVGLKPGDAVADIGAGTGLFTQLFAEQVGPQGTVYAVDIGPRFLDYIDQQARQKGREKIIKTVLSTQDSANLPADSADLAFICDTYHHFEHPEKMLASIHRALRPGGRLIIIDFDLRQHSSEFVKKRARAPKEVYFLEITTAGFQPMESGDAPRIKDNFYAVFRRVERQPPVPPATAPPKEPDCEAGWSAFKPIDLHHHFFGEGSCHPLTQLRLPLPRAAY